MRAADRAVLGSAGTSAPDPQGVVVRGYGIYPEHEGSGYATKAATALCRARLADNRVNVVLATIPIGHTASEKVATRAGLSATDQVVVQDGRTLRFWQVTTDRDPRAVNASTLGLACPRQLGRCPWMGGRPSWPMSVDSGTPPYRAHGRFSYRPGRTSRSARTA